MSATAILAQTNSNTINEDSVKKETLVKHDTVTDEKYYELKEELKRVNENQRNLLLKMYASEWQTYRMAEQPHILYKKKQIEKRAKEDGFSVEELKAYLAEEKEKKKKK